VDYKLLEYNEEASYFSSQLSNKESDEKILPSRAFRKTYSDFYGRYINEVLFPIKKEDLPKDMAGYQLFDKHIEEKIRKKSLANKINIITFFGDKNLDLSDLSKFEDISLIAEFEQRYNDCLFSFPFTLKFREKEYLSENILAEVKAGYKDFSSSLKSTNLLGYVPAYISHRSIEDFIKIYLNSNCKIQTSSGSMNLVPLLIDCKNSNPETFKRTLVKLRRLKLDYLKEGYYLFYYGFSLGMPRIGGKTKKPKTLAKDFLLSFLGFDILGNSRAIARKVGGGTQTEEKVVGKFSLNDFNYHSTKVLRTVAQKMKPENLSVQSDYLADLSTKLKSDREIALKELKTRNEADVYLQDYK
jgi:hypothetical protein